ncbi:MAG: hypothetical protein HKM95_02795 [Inquilinus sp.]|nr:hypothetical protein [Inquilinus sp.]
MNSLVRIIAAATLAAVFGASSAATAQEQQRVPCGDRVAIMSHLEDGYSEKPVAMGLDAQGRVLEVLAAPSGTWTMLVSTPGGLTCLIASGVAWEELQSKAGVDPAA